MILTGDLGALWQACDLVLQRTELRPWMSMSAVLPRSTTQEDSIELMAERVFDTMSRPERHKHQPAELR
jgi:hypothetical protein